MSTNNTKQNCQKKISFMAGENPGILSIEFSNDAQALDAAARIVEDCAFELASKFDARAVSDLVLISTALSNLAVEVRMNERLTG